MVLGLQQRLGNQAVQRYLGVHASAPGLLQRKDGDAAAPAEAAPAAPAAGGAGAPATPTGAPATTVPVTISAIYENVPGESKNKVKKAGADDALWFDPLKTHSDAPDVKESTKAFGVLTGGQQVIDTFSAPITGGAKPIGRGSITAQLKYTNKREDSFDVQVTGLTKADEVKAEKAAKAFVLGKIDVFGDIDEIATQAEASIAPTYPNAKVSIKAKPNQVKDTGRSSFHYKIRSNAGILIDVQVVPVAEKQTTVGGSKTVGTSSEDATSKKDSQENSKKEVNKDTTSSERTSQTSEELVETEYNHAVVKTLDDYVAKVTSTRAELARDLAQQVVTDENYNDKKTTKSSYKDVKHEDYTKKVKKGQKKDDNWASYLKKGVNIVKEATSIPFIDKLPGRLGKAARWITRKVKGWQLDIVGGVADMFAESGKVDYEDTEIKKDSKDEGSSKETVELEGKRHKVEDTKSKLAEDYKKDTNEKWEKHLNEVTTTSGTYKNRITKSGSGSKDSAQSEKYDESNTKDAHEAAEAHKKAQNQSTTTTFQVSQNWTFSVPIVKATVVSGTAEVSSTPFGPDPDEAPAPAPNP